jgi:hypothetical protein
MNNALWLPPNVPRELTIATWGALFDLLAVGKQPDPKTGARLLELELVIVIGERSTPVARVDRRRVVAVYALTLEGERVARLAPRSITGGGLVR